MNRATSRHVFSLMSLAAAAPDVVLLLAELQAPVAEQVPAAVQAIAAEALSAVGQQKLIATQPAALGLLYAALMAAAAQNLTAQQLAAAAAAVTAVTAAAAAAAVADAADLQLAEPVLAAVHVAEPAAAAVLTLPTLAA